MKSKRTILHLSDLHFGRGFQEDKWNDALEKAVAAHPDIVIVTGDLVNSPWRWQVPKVFNELTSFRNTLRERTGNEVEMLLVPGNHDTRFSGVLPLQWLTWIALALLLTGAILAWRSFHSPWYWAPFACVGAAGLVLRLCLTRDFKRTYGDLYRSTPQAFPAIKLGVIPFDSASVPVWSAQGKLRKDAIHAIRAVSQAPDMTDPKAHANDIFWVAAVHHHPLPIPYYAKSEPQLIMQNAGTLLAELTKAGVPLVLHGHKHHSHFSRLSIRKPNQDFHEIGVVAAGTSSQGAGASHAFNVMEVDEDQRVEIYVYEAKPGGTFDRRHVASLASSDQYKSRDLSMAGSTAKAGCDFMLSSAEITKFGDSVVVREFSGLTALGEALRELPGVFRAKCDNGEVEPFEVAVHSSGTPSLSKIEETTSTHETSTRLALVPDSLKCGATGVDFHLRTWITNAFALNAHQYFQMYLEEVPSLIEEMKFDVPQDIVVRHLTLQLRFPAASAIPAGSVFQVRSDSKSPWRDLPSDNFHHIRTAPALLAHVRAPKPGSQYRFYWRVPASAPEPASRHAARYQEALIGDAFQDATEAFGDMFMELLAACESIASDELKAEQRTDEISLALYAYNRSSCELTLVGAAGEIIEDTALILQFRYGLGLPGRALKLGEMTVFDRQPLSQQLSTPAPGHLLYGNTKSPGTDGRIGTAIAFPLWSDNDPSRTPYAVMCALVNGDGGHLKMQDTGEDAALSNFHALVRQQTESFIRQAILTKH
ncbi:metallophosphoesterase family protein [Paraburkholderia lycopersici]|uniref:3',5'-cyclic AMP phosphodiesterase CpdA n=1 Tax=Paraburkholderia lycopersici TaxID=416944 RepID=A0A1G6Z0N9_9BURK|nr:metallophosphoesterase [Paraburkholderia lycopersici]SDD96168.1 3',5'-cyclic AMP phosphodiesterase CpdA [Paraburkholderia lycopersici]